MVSKLEGLSLDLEVTNKEKLKSVFPECFSEGTLDIDKLLSLCGEYIDNDFEKYKFEWKGKAESLRLAQKRSTGTLRPCRKESVNFDTTENLYIEGDNLEVLKLLQTAYFQKVKMIYIDPPYNTGNDFVYEDDFKDPMARYKEVTNQTTKSNPETMGRYHTNWLNMMYPRLRLASNLLRDDGVIFISIDDNEVHNLRKVCDEIFGEENFINIVTIKTKIGGVSGSSEGKSLKDATEFILMYSKNKNELLLNPVYIEVPLFDRIKKYKDEGKSWKYTSIMTKLEDKVLIKNDVVRGIQYYGYKTLETKSIASYAKENGITEEEVYNQFADKIFRTTNAQSSVRQAVIKETSNLNYPMYGCEYVPIKGKNVGQTIEILYKTGSKNEQRNMMMFLSEVVKKIDGIYYYMEKVSSLWDDIQYNNLTKEGNVEFPNGKKPIKLLQRLLELTTNKDSIVVDFFSGSSSTAHATMELNKGDGGNRKYIMVQLPELIDEKSEAFKAGYKNICEIGKERIKRAGKEIFQENNNIDIGFKVFKLDTSNVTEWDDTPIENHDLTLFDERLNGMTNSIKSDRNDMDVVYEIMLKMGVSLDTKITYIEIRNKKAYVVGEFALLICLEDGIEAEDIEEMINFSPEKIICAEQYFKDDSSLSNTHYILKDKGIEFKLI